MLLIVKLAQPAEERVGLATRRAGVAEQTTSPPAEALARGSDLVTVQDAWSMEPLRRQAVALRVRACQRARRRSTAPIKLHLFTPYRQHRREGRTVQVRKSKKAHREEDRISNRRPSFIFRPAATMDFQPRPARIESWPRCQDLIVIPHPPNPEVT
jgi:hypothetical protein